MYAYRMNRKSNEVCAVTNKVFKRVCVSDWSTHFHTCYYLTDFIMYPLWIFMQ